MYNDFLLKFVEGKNHEDFRQHFNCFDDYRAEIMYCILTVKMERLLIDEQGIGYLNEVPCLAVHTFFTSVYWTWKMKIHIPYNGWVFHEYTKPKKSFVCFWWLFNVVFLNAATHEVFIRYSFVSVELLSWKISFMVAKQFEIKANVRSNPLSRCESDEYNRTFVSFSSFSNKTKFN